MDANAFARMACLNCNCERSKLTRLYVARTRERTWVWRGGQSSLIELYAARIVAKIEEPLRSVMLAEIEAIRQPK